MATSGSYSALAKTDAGLVGGAVTFSWERTSVDYVANTSVISWRLTITAQEGYKCNSGKEDFTIYFDYLNDEGNYINLSGVTKTIDTDTSENGEKLIWAGTETIKNRKDGSSSFRVNINDEGDSLDIWFYKGLIPPLAVVYLEQWFPTTFELDKINRGALASSSYDFTDEEEKLTFYYTNRSGASATTLQACISFTGEKDDIPYRDIDKSNVWYDFVFTDAERKILRQGITSGNSRQVRIYIKSIVDGYTYYDYVTRTLTLVNYEPTLAPTVKDTNTVTKALTGDENTLVRYFSNAYFTTGASARKEASIASQTVTSDNTVIVEDAASGTIAGVTGGSFHFKVTDTRGYTTEQTIEKTIIPYVKLTANSKIEELDLNGNFTFSVSGSYYGGSFGVVDNALIVKYTLKKNGQAISSNVSLNPLTQGIFTLENNQYVYKYTITGLVVNEHDLNDSFSIQVTVNDKLITIATEEKTTSATPIFEWNREEFNFSVPVHFGRGFTNDVGLKTTSFIRTLDVNRAGSFPYCTLDELGIDSYAHNIYLLAGAIEYQDKIYPIPSPALSNGVGAYSIADSTKLWIEGEQVYLTVGAAWGAVSIRAVVMYF